MNIPKNVSILNSLSKTAPRWLTSLFENRGCEMIKCNKPDSKNNTEDYATISKPNILVKVRGLHDLSLLHYPLIPCALAFVRSEVKANDDSCRLLIKAPEGLVPPLTALAKNFCSTYSLSQSTISVEASRNEWKINAIDYLCNETSDLSVRLLDHQRKHDRHAPELRHTPYGLKLADVIGHHMEASEWKEAYKQHRCQIMFRSKAKPRIPSTSIPVLEHVTHKGAIPEAFVVDTPHWIRQRKHLASCSFMLNPLTSPLYDIYQFCIKISDQLLKQSFISLSTYTLEEIEDIIDIHQADPAQYYGQIKLAQNIIDITRDVTVDLEELQPGIRYLFSCGKPKAHPHSPFIVEQIEKLVPTVELEWRESFTLPALCEDIHNTLPELLRPDFNNYLCESMETSEVNITKGEGPEKNYPINFNHIFTLDDTHMGTTLLSSGRGASLGNFILIKWCGI